MSDLMLDVDQAGELKAAFRRAGWTNKEIKSLCEGDNPVRVRKFLNSGCQLVVKGPSALLIDRTKPFDPTKFIGSGWQVVEQDERALKLTDIDFSTVRFESGLKEGESVISGEEKLTRLKALPNIRYDAKVGQVLYEEKEQATLRFLHEQYGITWFELAGTVLRDSYGDQYFLYLYRLDDGSWLWHDRWLDYGRDAKHVSPVSASNT